MKHLRTALTLVFGCWLALAAPLTTATECAAAQGLRAPSDKTPARLNEMPPFNVLGKNWSASRGMKAHFDLQREVLRHLGAKPVPNGQQRVEFAAVGDIMRLPQHQPDFVDQRVLNYLQGKDFVTGNLETLISPRFDLPPPSLFLMNSDPALLTAFSREDGSNLFSVLSLANNHTFDYDDRALDDTLALLGQLEIPQSGLRRSIDEKPYQIITVNGLKIGYYALATFMNIPEIMAESDYILTDMIEGIASLPFQYWRSFCEINLTSVKQALDDMAAEQVDVRVISLHWGHEHDMYPKPVQIMIAQALARAGADILIGAHTHTPQPAEVCFINGAENQLPAALAERVRASGCVLSDANGTPRKSMIYYSLGNFTSYSPIFWQQLGLIAELTLVKDDAGTTDWHAPGFVLTYDDVRYAPHGKREMTLLRDYVDNQCHRARCPAGTESLVKAAHQHLMGRSQSSWEDFKIFFQSARHTVAALWEAKQKGEAPPTRLAIPD